MYSSVARAIACLLVVLVHVNMMIRPALDNWWPGGFFCAPLFSIPVPLFFMLSGYSTGMDKSGSSARRTMRSRVKRLILPFFAWNLILLLLDGRLPLFSGEALFSLLTGAWQLYFLFVLIQLQLIMHFLSRSRTILSPRNILVLAALLSFAFFVITDLVLWTMGGVAGFFETHLNRLIFPWVVFFAVGILLHHEPDLMTILSRRIGLITLITLIAYAAYLWEMRLEAAWLGYNPLKQFLLSGFFFQIGASLLCSALLQLRTGKARDNLPFRFLTAMGRDAYGIYLAHTSVLLILLSLYNRTPLLIPFLLEPPLICLGSLFGAWGLVRIARKVPWSLPRYLLFGIRGGKGNSL